MAASPVQLRAEASDATGGIPDELTSWIEAVAGKITHAQPLLGGNRRLGWHLETQAADGHPQSLYLRFDPADPRATGDVYTLAREAVVCAALMNTPVQAPPVIAAHSHLQAVLAGWVEGRADFHRVRDPDVREALAADFMTHVAALHRVDPRTLDMPGFPPVQDLPTHVEDELRTWESLYRQTDRLDPLIEFSLRWLWRNIPQCDASVVLVHGDAGPGNFLFSESTVTAVIDWELAHLGDPMEDLAWLSLRTAQETFPNFTARLAEYERESGNVVDPERLRYHRVFAQLRVVIIRHRAHGHTNPNGDIGNGLLSEALHRRLLVEALADVTQVRVDPPAIPPSSPTERDWLFEAALVQLRQIADAPTADAFIVRGAKGMARMIKYLQQFDRVGPRLSSDEVADLEGLLAESFDSRGTARTAFAERIRSGDVDDGVALQHLARAVARESFLMQSAMGALAQRHHPPLPPANDPAGTP